MADVALSLVPVTEKAALWAMMSDYLTAHAALVDPGRMYDPLYYPPFDLYWTEPERHPYWIESAGERAGFVLVNAYSPSGLGTEFSIAEFCVLPTRRRRGLGRAAALAAFEARPGVWELQVYRANPAGMSFWPRTIEAADPGDWELMSRSDRVIHRFRIASP